jgi:hypothetical protein
MDTSAPAGHKVAAAPNSNKPTTALFTRAEAAEFVAVELGFPLSFSTLEKLCALREGPPVARWWGRRPLYARNDLKAWAEARSRKTGPRSLGVA